MKYEDHVKIGLAVIDLAIEALKKFPPKELNASSYRMVIDFYEREKQMVLLRVQRFKTVASMKITLNDVLGYFQEGSGKAVNEFWKEAKERNLPIKKVNKLSKIIARKKSTIAKNMILQQM